MRLRIEKAIYGGAGLARHEGKAIFVPFTLPGEDVEAHVVQDKGGYATAELDTVAEPSAQRAAAPCRHFGECGGCHYQHADNATQVALKAGILREALERARIREIPEIAAVTGEPLGYRNRIRLHVAANPFRLCYKLRNSHEDLAIGECPIAAPVLQKAIEAVHRDGASLGLDEWIREIEFFTDSDGAAMLVSLWTKRPALDAERRLKDLWPRLLQIVPQAVGAAVSSAEDGRGLSRRLTQIGEGSVRWRMGALEYRVSLGSFFQVNRFLIERLVDLVAGGEQGVGAWDLYAGVGLFSVPLAERFGEVTAVESAAGSVRDLHENLRGTKHRVVALETASFLGRAVAGGHVAPDLVVVDPPRSGLGRSVTTALGKLRPPRITYVSCDPATLSRDLAALLESGYRLRKMHLVDLFPQTFHLESVTHLALE
ncbi:MAG TPA: 23S rRNA (uracil(1939)-C(5))-methyltransferase RlmD [Acidobacteriaceae bacterium]|nr:23S rRNA (uracil(1939)-C(5))-methyltransferase RlmD [Acidobacteriaceae bacterium]